MFYKVVCRAGYIKHDVISGLSWEEAQKFCNDHNWELDWNGGLIWDLEIEDDYTEYLVDVDGTVYYYAEVE